MPVVIGNGSIVAHLEEHLTSDQKALVQLQPNPERGSSRYRTFPGSQNSVGGEGRRIHRWFVSNFRHHAGIAWWQSSSWGFSVVARSPRFRSALQGGGFPTEEEEPMARINVKRNAPNI